MKTFKAKKIYAGLYDYRGLGIQKFEPEGSPVYWSIGDTVDMFGNRKEPVESSDYFGISFHDSTDTFAEAKYLVDNLYFNERGERNEY